MCTRFVYPGPDGRVLTGRSMDWSVDIGTNLWVFPRGLQRDGAAGDHSLRWTSRYGSVVASAYDVASTDGLNEAGLVANVLWLAESEYPSWDGQRPVLSVAAWAQYVLDSFATVAEAVAGIEQEPFVVATGEVPGQDRLATLHLSLSDASGDSAIVEYVGGRAVVHHGPENQVMTNSPIYSEQRAISAYWEQIDGTAMLPGTNRAADRYVRTRFYLGAVPKVADRVTATATVFSIIRAVSVPLGISTPGQPNISSTRWRTVADHGSRTYYFDSVLSPSVFRVELDDLDLGEGAPVLRLDVAEAQRRGLAGHVSGGGDLASTFTEAPPFPFAPATPVAS